jgi:hypothetical protein
LGWISGTPLAGFGVDGDTGIPAWGPAPRALAAVGRGL